MEDTKQDTNNQQPVTSQVPVTAPIQPSLSQPSTMQMPKNKTKKLKLLLFIVPLALLFGYMIFAIVHDTSYKSSLASYKKTEDYKKLVTKIDLFNNTPVGAAYNCQATSDMIFKEESGTYTAPLSVQVTSATNEFRDAYISIQGKNPVYKPLPLVGILPTAKSAQKSSKNTEEKSESKTETNISSFQKDSTSLFFIVSPRKVFISSSCNSNFSDTHFLNARRRGKELPKFWKNVLLLVFFLNSISIFFSSAHSS